MQPKIKAEMQLRKASGEYDLTGIFVPDGVALWTALPVPSNRDELNGLEALYEADRAATRRCNEKWAAHFKKKIGPLGTYNLEDLLDRETSLEDLRKRAAEKERQFL